MALVPITHVYDTLSVINNTGLLDGQILYTTDQTVNKIFADVKVNNILRRIEIGGTNEIDTVLNQESGHAIANSAVAKLAQTVHTNLINPTLGTTTINGVTCTKNSDGTYTLTGTATELVTLDICTIDVVDGVSYRLVGCPSGGSGTTYRMGLYTNESSPSEIIQDLGTGHNWASDRTATIKVRIVIQPNYAISGSLVFKPMLTTDLSATYDDFVQYSGNGELNQNVADLYNNLTALDTKVGAQSLLPTPSQSVTQNINTLKAEINQINAELSEVTLQRLNALGKDWDFYKVGKIVFLSAPSSTNSSLVVGSNNIGTLPSDYRPRRAAFGKAVNYSGSMYLAVNADGTVILTSDGAGKHNCAISLSYITN